MIYKCFHWEYNAGGDCQSNTPIHMSRYIYMTLLLHFLQLEGYANLPQQTSPSSGSNSPA